VLTRPCSVLLRAVLSVTYPALQAGGRHLHAVEFVASTPVADPAEEPWLGGTPVQLASRGHPLTRVEESVKARVSTEKEVKSDEPHALGTMGTRRSLDCPSDECQSNLVSLRAVPCASGVNRPEGVRLRVALRGCPRPQAAISQLLT